MKRLILLSACLTIVYSVFGQLPFYDGFESGSFVAGGWVASGGISVGTNSPAEGNFCAIANGAYGLTKTLNGISDSIVTLEFKVKPDQTDVDILIFRIRDGAAASANSGPGLLFRNNGALVALNGTTQITQLQYEPDSWYDIKVEMNMNTKTYNLYINNSLKGVNYGFYSSSFVAPVVFSWSCTVMGGAISFDEVNIHAGNVNISIPPTGNVPSGSSFVYDASLHKIRFTHEPGTTGRFFLMDISGKICMETDVAGITELPLPQLSPGVYLGCMMAEGGGLVRRKILIP